MTSSSASEDDERSATNTYELFCTDCSYETTVEGDVYDALDVADAHQDEYGEAPGSHFVTFKLGRGEE